jgi:hypothetical protein
MSISDSSLNVDVFNVVRTTIVGAKPIVTNSSTSATELASVRAAYNDTQPDKAQIIINPLSKDESSWKFGSSEGKKIINVTVDCFYRNTLGIDQLCDQVEYAIKTADISGIALIGVTTDYAFNMANDAKFHMKSITFSFDRE